MGEPAARIVLDEVDVELTLLGSLFVAPEMFQLLAEGIKPEWFSDPMARYLFETALKLHNEGSRLSAPAIVAALPMDCNGIPRGAFYARAAASAMPTQAIPGLISTMKDRWSRRALIDTANHLREMATRFEADPYELAFDAVQVLDTVNATKSAHRGKSFDDALDELSENAKAKRRGFSTGLMALNTTVRGYQPGQLYVVAGRPGMGKSAFMCSSLRRTAENGTGVAIFSLEMTAAEIAARCMSDALDDTRAPFYGNILTGSYSKASEEEMVTVAKDSMMGLPIMVEDEPRFTMSEISSRCRQLKAAWEASGIRLGVVCIDHMGLVTPSNRYAGNKVAEAGEVSGAARAMAKELDCCVLLLCQLSREVEKRDDKRPTLADLRWSGEIEQDAHVVAFLYREAYYLQQKPDAEPWQVQDAKNKLEFLVRKNRNGETSDIHLWCSIGHSSIRDIV
jgi:replicative DNA helicase